MLETESLEIQHDQFDSRPEMVYPAEEEGGTGTALRNPGLKVQSVVGFFRLLGRPYVQVRPLSVENLFLKQTPGGTRTTVSVNCKQQ